MIEPNYPEISVTNLYDDAMSDPDVALYLPSRLQLSNKLAERNFFFGVLRTLKPEYLNEFIQEAHKKCYRISPEEKEKQGMKISDTWLQELQKHPFISKKPGTAIYLMKGRSKLNRERKSQVKHELNMRLFKDLQKPEEMNIDAGAGPKQVLRGRKEREAKSLNGQIQYVNLFIRLNLKLIYIHKISLLLRILQLYHR